uniref:Uncharacterized protein n=1 Tax=Arundo donax TaxID=35708 RepID=A0A0A9H5V1_ARUDO
MYSINMQAVLRMAYLIQHHREC